MAIVRYTIIFSTVLFGGIKAECVNGTSEGCNLSELCYNNQCYPSAGPCINQVCQSGLTCILDNCLNLTVTTTTSTTTVSTTTATCQDRANNCAAVSYLCENYIYRQLMTQQCARTCGKCGQVTTPQSQTTPACVDMSAPGRGSDCSSVAYLCNNPLYYNLMTQQCPRTCNRCPGTNSVTQTPGCSDRAGASGTSNCASVAYLCQSPLYFNLMRQQCPRTCGYC